MKPEHTMGIGHLPLYFVRRFSLMDADLGTKKWWNRPGEYVPVVRFDMDNEPSDRRTK